MKALIIEDNPTISFALARLCWGAGWNVVTATTLVEAERVLGAAKSFEVISWDFNLKDGTTLELLTRYKGKFLNSIMIAASSDSAQRKLQLEAGCTYNAINNPLFAMEIAIQDCIQSR